MKLKKFLDGLPETDKPVVTILSGGLDSTILTHLLKKKYSAENIHALSFFYRQKQSIELQLATQTCLELKISHDVIDLSSMAEFFQKVSANIQNTEIQMPTIMDVLGDPQPITYVPYRNQIMLSLALAYAETVQAEFVFTGVQSHDEYGYWDTTDKFITRINKLIELNRKSNQKVIAPFARYSKSDEINLLQQMYVFNDFKKAIQNTISCYNPDEEFKSCGQCPTCSERIKNFINCHTVDPIPYKININWTDKCAQSSEVFPKK